MDAWIQSEARRELMERVEPQMQGDVRRVVRAFEGWFP